MVKNSTAYLYKRLFPYVKPYWKKAIIAFFITLPIGTLDASIAWVLKPYMDVVMLGHNGTNSAFFPALIIVFSLFQSALTYASNYLNNWVGQKVSIDVKSMLFKKLVFNDVSFFDRSTSGDIIFRYNNDVDLACSRFLNKFKQLITRIVSSISLIAVLFYNSAILASVALVILLVAVYPLTRVKKRIRELLQRTTFVGSSLLTHYTEAFNGNRVIASYNLQEYVGEKLDASLDSIFRLGMKMVKRTNELSLFMHTMIAIGIAATLWIQGYLIKSGMLTPGNFVSFIAALIMLYNPIKALGQNVNDMHMASLALERVFEIIDSVPAIRSLDGAPKKDSFTTAIEYKDVHFGYVPDVPILQGLNLRISVGESVAFVGHSGGGKTTIVNLLPRFYEVTSGSITIDGMDIREMDLASLRDLVAMVSQDVFLFTGSIKENIVVGKKDVAEKDIWAALDAACLSEFVHSLSSGLETQIGEKGVLLSGGQRQRLAIARAFIRRSPIVILDEATSALDNKSEAVVQEAIENLMSDRTILIIAHRLTTVINADKIVVIDKGRIAESGSHAELFAKPDGLYRNLYENQFH